MAARVIPGKGPHFDGLPWECADACSYPGRVLRGADAREQRKGRQYRPPVLNPTSGALTRGLVRGRSKTSRSEKVRGRKVSGEANPRTPDSVGRIRWRGEKPHERQIPITDAARRANATTSALQDTGVADFVNGVDETLESLRRIPRSWLANRLLLTCVVEYLKVRKRTKRENRTRTILDPASCRRRPGQARER